MDPLPLFQRGVIDALKSNEILVEAPVDILAWAAQGGQRVIILTLASSMDWSLLEKLSDKNTFIAVLDEATTALSVKALHLGAESVIIRSATVSTLRRALEAVLAGDSMVPRSVIRSLLRSSPPVGERTRIPEEQIEWLRSLASGSTIARLATKAGYSERAMYRLLNRLYSRMGVKNRTEALMKASERGWLITRP